MLCGIFFQKAGDKTLDEKKVERRLKRASQKLYNLRKSKAGQGKPDIISFKLVFTFRYFFSLCDINKIIIFLFLLEKKWLSLLDQASQYLFPQPNLLKTPSPQKHGISILLTGYTE